MKENEIPYIISQGEAEAQCKEIERINECDYIATNDSDIFGYGGKKVIRNFLIEKEEMKIYEMETIGYTQEQIILYSIIVGNDYTEGIKGIGKKKGKLIIDTFTTIEEFIEFMKTNNMKQTNEKLMKIKESITLPKHFPNEQIINQFKNPDVYKIEKKIEWKENTQQIKEYCKNEFKWDENYLFKYWIF